MMYRRRLLQTEDFERIQPIIQPAQKPTAHILSNPLLRNAYYTPPWCWSLERDGELVACVGIIPKRDAGYAWALLSENLSPYGMVRVHKLATWLLTMYSKVRKQSVKVLVSEGFEKGETWVRLLGMVPVGRMEKPDGIMNYTVYEKPL